MQLISQQNETVSEECLQSITNGLSKEIVLTSVGFLVGDSVGFLVGDSVGFFVGLCRHGMTIEGVSDEAT